MAKPTKSKRKNITEELEEFSLYDFEGSVDVAINMLRAKKREHLDNLKQSGKWSPGATLRIVVLHSHYMGDDQRNLTMIVERPETDTEYVARLEKEQEAQRITTERELEEFERLKAKFMPSDQ